MTLTKEWLLKTISELEEERDATPGAVNEDAANALAAMKLALASLTAEPVAYIDPFSLQNFATYRAGETDNKRMGREWMWADSDAGLVPVYTAPPAPVVPDIGEISVGRLPTMNQDDYPGLGDWWVQLRIGKDSDEVLARVYGATPQEANSRAVALACRAAMLQGAENAESTTTMQTAPALDSSPKIAESTSGNSPVIPDEVLSAVRRVACIREDFDDFDGDRRGIGDCLDEAEQELIVTINKYASVIAAAQQQEAE